jgi:hypothetical protein
MDSSMVIYGSTMGKIIIDVDEATRTRLKDWKKRYKMDSYVGVINDLMDYMEANNLDRSWHKAVR